MKKFLSFLLLICLCIPLALPVSAMSLPTPTSTSTATSIATPTGLSTPSALPSVSPTPILPSATPSVAPTVTPTPIPSTIPSMVPTVSPTPIVTPPTATPSSVPTPTLTASPTPTANPTPSLQGKITITVLSSQGEAIENALFEIYRASDEVLMGSFQTGSGGHGESALLSPDSYYLKQKTGKAGYTTDPSGYAFVIDAGNLSRHFSIQNDPIVGTLHVTATDENSNQSLPNAVLVLSGKNGEVATLTTDTRGEALYKNLPYGDYTLKEKTAPSMYSLYSKEVTFSIDTQGQVIEKTIAHSKGFSTLEILCIGENKEKLSGASFEILNAASGEKVHQGTTNQEGKISLVLPLGSYDIKQTAAAKGYAIKDASTKGELLENGAIVSIEIENTKKPILYGTIEITATDEVDGAKKLEGAVFVVTDTENKEKILELKTDASGMVKSTLPVGSYEISELTAPTGYALSGEKQSAKIEENKALSLTFKHKALPKETGNLQIVKTDADKRLLSGAVFEVLGEDQKVICELTTGENGLASTALPVAKYLVREVKAPEGYVLDSTEKKIEIQSGKTEILTITNQKETVQNLHILKSAAGSGKRLAGAVFSVYKEGSHEKIQELTTNENGFASASLEVGTYYLLEIEAPTGYTAEKAKIPFVIKSKEQVVRVEVSNQESNASLSENPSTGGSLGGAVQIPKTGQILSPILPILLGAATLSLVFAFFYGKKLIKEQE